MFKFPAIGHLDPECVTEKEEGKSHPPYWTSASTPLFNFYYSYDHYALLLYLLVSLSPRGAQCHDYHISNLEFSCLFYVHRL